MYHVFSRFFTLVVEYHNGQVVNIVEFQQTFLHHRDKFNDNLNALLNGIRFVLTSKQYSMYLNKYPW